MIAWVPVDPTELDLEENRIIQGAPVIMTPALYDIPEAVSQTRLPSGIFEMRFRYLLGDEPLDVLSVGLFDLYVGRNSKRLYRLVGYCREGEMLDCLRDVFLHLKTRYPRREGNYKALAAMINHYLNKPLMAT